MAIQEPVIPGINAGAIWAPVQKELTWLQKHERIVIVALVLSAGVFLGNKWLNYDSAQKDARVAALTAQVAQDKVSVQNLALQAATAQATYQTTLDAITKQNVALEGSIAQMSASLAQRQKVDSQLPLPELGKRLEALVPAAQGGVIATTNGLALNATASYGVVNALEQVPVLTAQLKDETQVAANNQSALTSANTVIVDKTNQITGLNKSLTDQQAHEVAAVAAEKLKAKKAWRSGFKWGFAAGAALVGVLTHGI